MAKDKEKIEQEKTSETLVPFSPIPYPGGSMLRQTTCLTRPQLCDDGSISTSTPLFSRRSIPLVLDAFDEIDGSCIRIPTLPKLDISACESENNVCKTPPSSSGLVSFLDIFDLDNDCVQTCEKDFDGDEKKTIDTDKQSDKLPEISEKSSSAAEEIASCESDSLLFQFKKPMSSPPGSRKRLPAATVIQLHKDSIQEQKDMQCYCHRQVSSKVEPDLANISIISTLSESEHLHENNTSFSACNDVSIVSHNDSGYQTFNSTGLSVNEDNEHFSPASSTPFPTKLDIPLPLLPASVTAEVKQLTFDEVLDKHSPSYNTFRDTVIGPKIGLESLDVVTELYHKGAWTCLHLILGNLEVKDIQCMCSVSSTWKRVCLDDTRTRQRLKEDKENLKERTFSLGKENLLKLKQRAAAGSTAKPGLSCNPSLQNKGTLPVAQPISPTKLLTRGDQYVSVASKLKNEECLDKCPRCVFPAKVHKVQERGYCTKQACLFDYCTKCRMGFHGSRSCVTLDGNRSKIGGVATKRSKKNLRRL